MNTIFKGFKQVSENDVGVITFESGYLYFVRTNENKEEGYLYFNGKKYGNINILRSQLDSIEGGMNIITLRAWLYGLTDGTYTKEGVENLLNISFEELIEAIKNGAHIRIFSSDLTSANVSFVIESNYTLTDNNELNTLNLSWVQYRHLCIINLALNTEGTYNLSYYLKDFSESSIESV